MDARRGQGPSLCQGGSRRYDLDQLLPSFLRIDHDIIKRKLRLDEGNGEPKVDDEWKPKNAIEIARENILYLRDQDPKAVRKLPRKSPRGALRSPASSALANTD